MIKYLCITIIIIFIALLTLYPNKSDSSNNNSCSNCYSDVAAATYYAFNELDCDSNNEPDAPCDDELQDINVGPSYVNVTQKNNITTVKLTITQTNQQQDHFTITFNSSGSLLQAYENTTWPS